jgi:geranylgeranyl diphosphate synthase type I
MMLSTARTSLLRERFDSVLAAFLDRQGDSWSDGATATVLAAIRDFVLGDGKRVRPKFCYWGWRAAGGDADEEEVFVVGAALELFHAFALIHDDIMDCSDVRRGAPTVHRVFAAMHPSLGGRGDADGFGVNAALLCGDLCAAWSDQLLAECTLPAPQVRAAQRLFAAMRAEAIAGQYLDLMGQTTGLSGWSVERALQVTRLKTARYTVTRPLQIGATLGGGSPALLSFLAAFGDPLGEAYQLRDDILGVFGHSWATGKSTMDDLRAAKPTVLLALTFARADAAQGRTLRALVGDPGLDEAAAAQIADIIRASGALAATEALIEERAGAASAALADLPVPEDVRSELASLADRAVVRTR